MPEGGGESGMIRGMRVAGAITKRPLQIQEGIRERPVTSAWVSPQALQAIAMSSHDFGDATDRERCFGHPLAGV